MTSVSVFLNKSILIECIFVSIPSILFAQARLFRPVIKNIAVFIVLLLVQLVAVPKLPVAAGGIVYMFAVYVRKLIPCLLLGLLLIRTTKVSAFLAAISRLHLPKGFTIALSVALRYFPTMTEEWGFIKDAMSLRGISFSKVGLLIHPVKIMEYVYVPMLVSASKISDEITQAAITRGIDHVGRRSSLETVEFRIWDVVFIIVYIGIIALVVFDLVRGGVFI